MSKNVRQLMVFTFGVIALVVILTRRQGFASMMQALSSSYRGVVGAFIRPV